MKWVQLSGYKKDIPANQPLLIWQPSKESANGGNWHKSSYLLRIEFDGNGNKQHVFKCGEDEVSNATHVMLIEKPKDTE